MSRNSCRSMLLSLLCVAATLAPLLPHAHTGVFVTWLNRIYVFDTNTPLATPYGRTLSGLRTNESILAIDYRPQTNQLYALGSLGRLYVIDPATAVATQVGTNVSLPLAGTAYGFDFNPTVDRIRVVSNGDQNLRLNPVTGDIAATDTNLAYAAGDPNFGANPDVYASAYTNNFAGATTTVLYGIDNGTQMLVTQNPPNSGTLNTVGPLGVVSPFTITFRGFDIVTDGGVDTAYAVNQESGDGVLYRINLATGAATRMGVFMTGDEVTGFAVMPSARLSNVSTRGHVLTGDNVMIGGFIIQGQGPQMVLVRARGPSLEQAGVPSVLANPQLQIFSGQTPIAYNDNWQDSNAAAIAATGYAPPHALESAILITLQPGGYTGIVTGVGGATGNAIVEVFTVP
jgi:hypothetical protein